MRKLINPKILIPLIFALTFGAYATTEWGNLFIKGNLSVTGSNTFSALTATTVPYLNASKVLTSSAVTPTELGYLSGVTSAIQTQLDAGASDALSSLNCSIATSVGSNALTISLKDASGSDPSSSSACKIAFRSTTASTGSYSVVNVTAATSVVVSSGSTLGSTSGAAMMLYVYAINNSGTVELGVINGLLLDESATQTSTTEGGAGGADTIGTFYSTTGRTSKAVRLLGQIAITEATAGTWASNATTVYSTPITPKKNLTIQTFTSGSGTYTTPAGAKWIRIRLVGGGGSGGTNASDGAAGSDTTFGSLTGGGGGGGGVSGAPATGGSATGGDINIPGAGGQGGSNTTTDNGGNGGASPFGGAGAGAQASTGNGASASANSGSGGGGGCASACRAGGGAGGYVEKYITNPAATYSYAIGTGGTGPSGAGSGAAGLIIIEEYY